MTRFIKTASPVGAHRVVPWNWPYSKDWPYWNWPYKQLATLLVLLVLCVLSTGVKAAGVPRAVLIIDGSGSMWGRVDGREKIVIVRSLLAEKIGLLKGKIDLGVMSYGHRRRRDCRDIEMITPIAPIKLDAYRDKIKRLLPRGKTPTSSALQMAAEALTAPPSDASSPLHIILVADGIENCRIDPCKTATELASTYPRLKIDVIGFSIKDEEIPQLRCLADATKGRFITATSANELEVTISDLFARLGQEAILSRPRPVPKKKVIPPGLYLSAGLDESGAPLKSGLSWRFYRSGESSKTGNTPLKRNQNALPFLELPQGSYHIEVRYKSLLAQGNVQLSRNSAQKKRLSFNVGVVTTSARLSPQSPPSSGIIFSLYDISKGPAGPANNIAHKQGENAVFYLPPGQYALKARTGQSKASESFSLKAGQRKAANLLLNAGHIGMKTTLSTDTAPLDDVQYAIFRRGDAARKNDADKDVEFVRTLDPTPQLVLPTGNYFVLARRGAATHYSTFSIRPGDRKELSLSLDAGVLNLSAPHTYGSSREHPQIAYTLTAVAPTRPRTIKLSPEGKLAEIDQILPIRSFRNSFTLPEGDYLIYAHYGNSNAGTRQRVHISAGANEQVKIEMSAGRIKLSLGLMAGDPPLPNVFWSIVDQNGKQVASASSPAPRLTLANGAYQAIAQYLGQNFRRDFILRSGENKTLQLSVQ